MNWSYLMDIENVQAGRAAVEYYRNAHDTLHQQVLTPAVLQVEHEAMQATLIQELAEHGFESLAQYESDEMELQCAEAADEMRNLVLPEGESLRFVDLSHYSHEEYRVLMDNAKNLRAEDKIPDTVYYWAFRGLAKPIIMVTPPDGGNEIVSRAAANGIDPFIIELRGQGRRHYSYQNDAGLTYLIKGWFAGRTEARKAAYAVCLRMLEYLGVNSVSVRPGSNNFKVNGGKIAGGMALLTRGFYLMSTPITLDLDYDLICEIFADSSIRDRVVTLRQVLGYEVSTSMIKEAARNALAIVFNCEVVADTPGLPELHGIGS
jgi:hypothetical protein